MGAVGHNRQETHASLVVAAVIAISALVLLVGAMVLPASAAAAGRLSPPELVVHSVMTELVPGKSLDALLTYTTNEFASVRVELAFLGATPLNTRWTSRPTRRTPKGACIVLEGEDGAVRWDGSAAHGNSAPAGIYRLQVTAKNAAGATSAPQRFLVTLIQPE
ncbi:MAG: hypothetical protein ACYC6T_03040 [Thermoleophilia bacterium]